MCGCRNKAMREPTDASEPDTQAHNTAVGVRDTHNHSPSPPQSLTARYSVRVLLYVLATCVPLYTAFHAQ